MQAEARAATAAAEEAAANRQAAADADTVLDAAAEADAAREEAEAARGDAAALAGQLAREQRVRKQVAAMDRLPKLESKIVRQMAEQGKVLGAACLQRQRRTSAL